MLETEETPQTVYDVIWTERRENAVNEVVRLDFVRL